MPPNAYRAQSGYGPSTLRPVPPRVVVAGIGERSRALLVDGAIVLGAVLGAWLLGAMVFSTDRRCAVTEGDRLVVTTCTDLGTWRVGVVLGAIVVGLVVGAVTYAFPVSRRGASLGMSLVGLGVVDASTGGRIDLGRSVGRFLLGAGSAVVTLGATYLWQLRDEQARAWHDKVTHTLVVVRGADGGSRTPMPEGAGT